MSTWPADDGNVIFEKESLVWAPRPGKGERREVPWSSIRLVTTGEKGATVHSVDSSLFIPEDVVWFEFVVEDIIAMARKANPNYEGPPPTPEIRSLAIPTTHAERLVYVRRAQRFYKDRCPNYQEFQAFLEANPDWSFDEGSYYECSMSLCSGSPVDEGYSSDLIIPPSQAWYRRFEKAAGQDPRTGAELLKVLKTIEP
jgi:hypothetical protein